MRRWNYSLSITALHDGGLVLLEVPDTPPSPERMSCINDRAVSKGLSVVDARHPTFHQLCSYSIPISLRMSSLNACR